MSYTLGVDLGTTYSAAAVEDAGRTDMISLGDHASDMPSVVLLKDDGTLLTGDAADRRAMLEPNRVAREFKRRLGDPTPLILGGSPQSAQALMANMLQAVVRKVQDLQGRTPDQVVLSHPANWGPYKRELFGQVARIAGLDEVRTITEPEAAAVHYALTERVDPGALVAVYDLGGGTFDAAVLKRTEQGFEILGNPEGVERLGGIDFDEAVFAHVTRSLNGRLEQLDPADSAAMSAVSRLRHECVVAKETLSQDTEATIPVMLPGFQSEVRLTRDEFEGMISSPIGDTITALRRALQSAEVEASELSAVLLVGGSSRIPLVARMVSAELGRPTAVDAHPKHSVAMGNAALLAAANGKNGKNGGAGAAALGAAGAAAAGAAGAAAAKDAAAAGPAEAETAAGNGHGEAAQGATGQEPTASGDGEAASLQDAAGSLPPKLKGPPAGASALKRHPRLAALGAVAVLAIAGGVGYYAAKTYVIKPTPAAAQKQATPKPTATTAPTPAPTPTPAAAPAEGTQGGSNTGGASGQQPATNPQAPANPGTGTGSGSGTGSSTGSGHSPSTGSGTTGGTGTGNTGGTGTGTGTGTTGGGTGTTGGGGTGGG